MNPVTTNKDQESKYYEQNVEKVLNFYDLNYIPTPSTRHIKIFVCSHHEEFEFERMLLNSILLPDLQNYCLHYGYDIQLVDYNSGCPVDPYYDPQIFDNSFSCIEDCFTLSKGVFFIGFLGEKDGNVSLPSNVSVSGMDTITENIRKDSRKMNLVSEWYSENNVGAPFYSIQGNFANAFPNYYKNNEASKAEHFKWIKTYRELGTIFQEETMKAYKDGKIDTLLCHKSTLIQQVQKALTLSSIDSDNQCIFLLRENFRCTDQELRRQLTTSPHVFNIPRYSNRMTMAINPDKSVLENILVQEVVPRIKALIQKAILKSTSKSKITNLLVKQVYKEVLVHLNHFKTLRTCTPTVVTQPDIIERIRMAWGLSVDDNSGTTAASTSSNMVTKSQSSEQPKPVIIITGEEGSGKSTLVAQLVSLAHHSYPRDKANATFIILRYAGLTPKTLNASQFLRNLCLQLFLVLNPQAHKTLMSAANNAAINDPTCKTFNRLNTYNLAKLIVEFNALIGAFGDPNHLKRKRLILFIEDFHHIFHPLSNNLAWASKCFPNLQNSASGSGTPTNASGLANTTNPGNVPRDVSQSPNSTRDTLKMFPVPLPPNVHIIITFNSGGKLLIPTAPSAPFPNSNAQMTPVNQTLIAVLKEQFGQNSLILSLDHSTAARSMSPEVGSRGITALQDEDEDEEGSGERGKAVKSYPTSPVSTLNYSLSNPLTIQEIFLSCYKHSKESQEPRWMHTAKEQHLLTLTLPMSQKTLVSQALLAGKSPLFAETIAILIKDWPAKYKPPPNAIPSGILLVIKSIFDKIDQQTNSNAFIDVLKYISSAHIGITELELLDLLSCNKQLMETFYGPNLNIDARFPVYIWTLIKKQLSLMLCEKVIDGKILMFWNHKIYSDIAKMYSIQKPIEKTQIHCDMANLFLETIYLCKETNSINILPSTTIPLNYRGITAQPLLFNDYQYNMRRIYELWFHLLYTGDIKLLKFHALCNFDYLMAVVHGASLGYLFYMFDKTLQRFLDYEIQTLCATLIKSVDIISKDHLQLACEIIGRLRNVDENISPYLDNLVIQAMEWCDSYTLPLLVPLSSWLEIHTPELYDAFLAYETTGGLSVIAPSSQHILLTTKTNQIYMYHLASHEFIRAFKGITGKVTALVIAYNSSFVACSTTDLNIVIWKIDKNEVFATFRPHDKEITCMLLSQDDKLIFTGAKDGKICWCLISNSEIVKLLSAHRDAVSSIMVNSFNEVLASSSEDGTVKIWLIETGLPLNYIEDVGYPIRKMILSQDDIFLGILCEEYHIQMRSLTTGSFLYRLDHKIPVTDFCFNIDTRFLIVGCKDAKIYIYNVHAQTLNTILAGHTAPIRNVLATMNNDFLISTCQEAVFIWNIKKPMKQDNILNHKGFVSCIKISKDGTIAISGSEDGSVKLWNLEFSELQEKLPDHAKAVTCVNFSPNVNYMVSGSRDSTINIKLLNEASSFIRFTGHQSPITNAIFSQDEKSIISSELNDIVKVWRVETGFTLLNCSVFSRILMVTPNSLYAVSGNRTNSMKIWKVEDGVLINSINHSSEITCVSITPNSKVCVTGSKDESLKVWEVGTGKLTQVLVGHEAGITCVTTSPNNQRVISGSKDHTVMMWSVDTGSTLQTYDDHTSEITAVSITQDNSVIISSSLDGTLRVWNSDTGNLITIFDCHLPITNFCMSPDANHIIVLLANDNHVLLMCLHNSPATDYRYHSNLGSIEEESGSPYSKALPIKMKPYRFSLYLGKNLIPKISTTAIPDQLLNANPLTGMSLTSSSTSLGTTHKTSVGVKGQPKLLRKQDSMSKIFFQTHHPFPCSPKMSDLIPDMNMEAKDKLNESGMPSPINKVAGTDFAKKNILMTGNLRTSSLTGGNQFYGQSEMLKTMTCSIQ